MHIGQNSSGWWVACTDCDWIETGYSSEAAAQITHERHVAYQHTNSRGR